MKIMVPGAGGLVGHALAEYCTRAGEQVVALDHTALDITDEQNVNTIFDRERPQVVINCAAWTNVDDCESDTQRAQNVNARGPELLALAARRLGALFITISTDYVFDGEKEGFYTQDDQPNPQSVYGISKLAGEQKAQRAWARTIVVRSGYIFGAGGTNFLSTVIDRAYRGEPMRAIDDAFGTPTYAPDLARQLHRLAQVDLPGTYHLVNAGEGASFAEFARRAIALAGLDVNLVQDISLNTLKRPAPRPRNSRLRCLISAAAGLDPLPSWQDALSAFAGSTRAGAVIRSST